MGKSPMFARVRMKFVLFTLIATLCVGCAPRDVSGTWILKTDRDFRGNPGVPVELIFAQRGRELTVSSGKGRPLTGKISGSKITWGLEKTGIPPLVDDVLVLTYAGVIDTTGNEVNGTWRLSSSVLDEKGHFEGRRKKWRFEPS